MKRIDNPLDAALGVYEGDPQDTVFETIVKIAGKLYLPIGMITALREHFSTLERQKRILEVLRVFKSGLESLQGESAQDAARTKTIEERLQSPKFMEAVLTAAEEAARTVDVRKLDRLACVLTNGLDPQAKVSDDEDLPSFVASSPGTFLGMRRCGGKSFLKFVKRGSIFAYISICFQSLSFSALISSQWPR